MYIIRRVEKNEIPNIQRFRADIYGSDGIEDPSRFIDGLYIDDDDYRSVHFAAFTLDGDEIIGVFKLTPRLPESQMRVESYWSPEQLRFSSSETYAELSRLAVAHQYRKSAVILALWQAAFRESVALGVTHTYEMQRYSGVASVASVGMPITLLGEKISIHGFDYAPSRITVANVVPSLFEKSSALAFFFSRTAPPVISSSLVLKPDSEEYRDFVATQKMDYPITSSIKDVA